MPILADYFIVVSVPPKEENIGKDGIEPTILFRYPEKDHKKHRFPENAPYFCFPEGAKIEYKNNESRKPFFFTFCFTVEDGSRSYGTTLYYFEPLKLNGERKMDDDGKQLYVPKALCVLSHQPMFSAFAIFLRELYRSGIVTTEDTIAEGEEGKSLRKSSFNSKLRKGSTCNIVDDVLSVEVPVERQIRYFIDYCPSLDPSLRIHLVAFQKLIEIAMPPSHCLPYTDKLCYESLLTSLAAKNIIKVVAALLQEQRVLLVSSQMDTLTLCAEAFISLLYPFKWMHPFVPLLPTQLIEYLEAPTPYLMGVQTTVYASEECQQALEGVCIVQLDYDKVMMPKGVSVESFPKPFVKKMEKFFTASIPPPSTRILYCDSANPLQSDYLVFEVMFGPGKLGIKMKNRNAVLSEGEQPIDCVYLENVPDEDITITGPGKRVALLRREPVILTVNGALVVNKSLKSVVQTISEAARPLTLRLQIGVAPTVQKANVFQSMRSSLTPVVESPLGELPSPTPCLPEKEAPGSVDLGSPLELSLDDLDALPLTSSGHYSPRALQSPYSYELEDRSIRRYYREKSTKSLLSSEVKQESEEEEDSDEKARVFAESMRVHFLLEICELLDGYEKYINDDMKDPDKVFNMKGFLKKVDEEIRPLVKVICRTQMFSHFIHDAYEYDDNYEVRVFSECMKLRETLQEYTEPYLLQHLSPTSWEMHDLFVEHCDNRGLPAGWETLVLCRDPEVFPKMNPELFGEAIKRMKITREEKPTSLIPENVKAVRKELKERKDKKSK